ncbi:hypothetical protein HMPREF1582_00846 [Gardnerella vaginalis JCP8151A]|nr:hypothetical protein HMPREF1582_00846 [Gardnerella vaginalis JCP8151A]
MRIIHKRLTNLCLITYLIYQLCNTNLKTQKSNKNQTSVKQEPLKIKISKF